MTSGPKGSVTHWIGGLKDGDNSAVRLLWGRYFEGLVRLARTKLHGARGGAADEEDVALSAFHSLCRGAALGRFPDLEDRDNLWRLVATITAQKAVDHLRHEGRLKRGGGLVRVESESAEDLLEQVAGREPSPAFLAMMAEQHARLLEQLGDESLRQVAIRKLEGDTNEEIAERLGCGLRTVERKLGVIRGAWLAEARP